MSPARFVDLCSDDEIGDSGGKDVQKRSRSVLETPESKWSGEVKNPCQESKKQCARQGFKDNRSSTVLSTSQSNSCIFRQGCSPVEESSPSSWTSIRPAPICRHFWKAGEYDAEQCTKAPTQNGRNHLRIHPMFLHSNATSHKWAFGAIAELLDNAVDEIQNGATFAVIDKTTNPQDGKPALLIQDDGGGMDPEAIRRCMSFGFSDKNKKCAIGQYGNGFKTSSMRLGADVIVFSRHSRKRALTQSVGLLSYTFLRQTGQDRIVVPLVDYERNASNGKLEPILPYGEEHFSSNLSVLLQWSPYSTEEMLLKQFDDIGNHGTKIVIYNLWLNDDGSTELDFDFDAEDIRINYNAELFQTGNRPKPDRDQHIANLYRFSLRAYASILYLRLPESFKIVLRGRILKHHNMADDLKFPEFILYKPHFAGKTEAAVVTTIGFLKEAPHVNIHGFNIYHRNRLILPFWRVVKDTTNSNARGVVGVLEANFVEPTHNKQDFEKTSLFQKLEARLRDMAMEYWGFHCGLIGYQQVKSAPVSVPSCEPLSSTTHNSIEQPVLLNHCSSEACSPRQISSVIGAFKDVITTRQHTSDRGLGQYSDNPIARSLEGPRKTTKKYSTVEPEPNWRPEPGSSSTGIRHNIIKQVQRLRGELDLTQREYRRLLAESQSTDIVNEKDVRA
ncbi:hypothetical protein RJ640_027977 [Escallonia rubra]|uniref:Morc S5 domain-containing protein n=1 Tax=Escallonia rubra TaxID=112253 RepID=A0AA88R5B6_9ASTE|nr:hypothetical protein RJ640_027977 [Escallonia rubra]